MPPAAAPFYPREALMTSDQAARWSGERNVVAPELMGQRQLRNSTTKILENGPLLLPLGVGLVFAAALLIGMHPNFAASRDRGPDRDGLDAE
jgi:hypothetical protein